MMTTNNNDDDNNNNDDNNITENSVCWGRGDNNDNDDNDDNSEEGRTQRNQRKQCMSWGGEGEIQCFKNLTVKFFTALKELIIKFSHFASNNR